MVHVNVPVPSTGATPTRLFKLDGLTVTHHCASGGAQDLTATAAQVGDLKIVTNDEHNPADTHGNELSNFGPASGTQDLYSGVSPTDHVVGRLIWTTPTGRVLTFDFQDDSDAFGGGTCTLAGMALAG
jgi:hypothetical protein